MCINCTYKIHNALSVFQTSQTEVIVDVIDVNDHNPQFSETQYTVMADDIVKDEVFLQLQVQEWVIGDRMPLDCL